MLAVHSIFYLRNLRIDFFRSPKVGRNGLENRIA